MNTSADALRREQIDAVLALAAPHVSKDRQPLIEVVAHEWFHQFDADDRAERTAQDLCGALLSHWQFGANRAAGRP
jgi:glutamate dehydrogenase